MHFKLGEKVLFLKEKGSGVVTKIDAKGWVWVEDDETGFCEPHVVSDVSKVFGVFSQNDMEKSQVKAVDLEVQKHQSEQSETASYLRKHTNFWEIDLHTHQLMDTERGKSKHELLTYQLFIFKKCLEKARYKHLRKLIVIHGVGKGILKAEIHDFLLGHPNVYFYDADFRDYGKGATEIELYYP